MRGAIAIFLSVVLVLVISGCQPQEIVTNYGGVDLKILEGTPPRDQIFDGQPFNIVVQLINSLPRRINDVSLCVWDEITESAGGIPGKQCTSLSLNPAVEYEGDVTPEISESIRFPEGGSYVYSGVGEDYKSTNIHVDLVYPADNTAIVFPVCFKENDEVETPFPCELREVFSPNDIDSDIAPIIIDKVEKVITPSGGNENQVILDIYLKNSGMGEVISRELNNKNLMKIEVESIGTPSNFECFPLSSEGFIDCKESTRKITCRSQVTVGQPIYQESIRINLFYDYKISQPIRNIKLTKGGFR